MTTPPLPPAEPAMELAPELKIAENVCSVTTVQVMSQSVSLGRNKRRILVSSLNNCPYHIRYELRRRVFQQRNREVRFAHLN